MRENTQNNTFTIQVHVCTFYCLAIFTSFGCDCCTRLTQWTTFKAQKEIRSIHCYTKFYLTVRGKKEQKEFSC